MDAWRATKQLEFEHYAPFEAHPTGFRHVVSEPAWKALYKRWIELGRVEYNLVDFLTSIKLKIDADNVQTYHNRRDHTMPGIPEEGNFSGP